MTLDGLSSPARIVRDRWGVPHIYAQSRDDLFFAQGFAQAQDRLFQMDLWRRSVQGRLSQVLGPNFIERDAMTRRIRYRGDLDAEWASYAPDAKAIAEAFVRGVNAWVALARERPPEEFALAGWKPEFWAPVDLLNRTDLFIASRRPIDESTPAGALVGDAIRRVGTPPFFLGLAAEVRLPPSLDVARGGPERVEGPNRFIRLEHPSRQYLVHLNGPGRNVIGATAPWLPGVAIGHDERATWDLAGVDLDPPAVEVVNVNPADPRQVDDNGRWVDTEIVKDAVIVKGRTEPFAFETVFTVRGVVVATDRERHLVFALRWRGMERGSIAALRALGSVARGFHASTCSVCPEPVEGQPRVRPSSDVMFAHPLGITDATRRRFNIGPLTASGDPLFRMTFDSAEWDRSTAMNAPGQSASPESAHFADLATLWAEGKSIPLAFSEQAVKDAAATTLTLDPATTNALASSPATSHQPPATSHQPPALSPPYTPPRRRSRRSRSRVGPTRG